MSAEMEVESCLTEGTIAEDGGSDEPVLAGGSQVATPSAVSEGIRRNGLNIIVEDGEEDDDDVEFNFARRVSLSRFRRNNEDNEDHQEAVPNEVQLENPCLEENRRRTSAQVKKFKKGLLKILKQFFKSAFSIIVVRRNLCPRGSFETTRKLGITVPKFLHPASVEYVKEVTRKLITMLLRNVVEGCVLHVMIEKNKTVYIIQRFVFKMLGSLNFSTYLNKDAGSDECDLREVRYLCRAALIRLITSEELQPIQIPQFSRWSISIGIKEEIAENNDLMTHLWRSDPNGHFFPWKDRPRYEHPLPELEIPPETSSSNLISNDSLCHGQVIDVSKCDMLAPLRTPENRIDDPSAESSPQLTGGSPQILEAKEEKEEMPEIELLEGVYCIPFSSFPITADLTFSLYALEYPAPDPTRRLFSETARNGRPHNTPNRGHHHRHRLLRASNPEP